MANIVLERDKDGTSLTKGKNIKYQWKGYFEELVNVENERETMNLMGKMERPEPEKITIAAAKLKSSKAYCLSILR